MTTRIRWLRPNSLPPGPQGTAYTRHDPADDVGRAIMATTIGGPTVEILVGASRYSMHHWKIVDGPDASVAGRLFVSWHPRIDLPPLHPPLRWRIQHSLRKWWNL